MLPLTLVTASALTIGLLCALIQFIIVWLLDSGMTNLYNKRLEQTSFNPESFCVLTSTTTSFAPTTTLGKSTPSCTAITVLASITATGRHQRSLSDTCYSLQHSHGHSFGTMYNGYNYLLFTSSWCMLSVVVYSVLWRLRLKRGLNNFFLRLIVAGNLLTIIFLMAATGVGADQTALPCWPLSMIMLSVERHSF